MSSSVAAATSTRGAFSPTGRSLELVNKLFGLARYEIHRADAIRGLAAIKDPWQILKMVDLGLRKSYYRLIAVEAMADMRDQQQLDFMLEIARNGRRGSSIVRDTITRITDPHAVAMIIKNVLDRIDEPVGWNDVDVARMVWSAQPEILVEANGGALPPLYNKALFISLAQKVLQRYPLEEVGAGIDATDRRLAA